MPTKDIRLRTLRFSNEKRSDLEDYQDKQMEILYGNSCSNVDLGHMENWKNIWMKHVQTFCYYLHRRIFRPDKNNYQIELFVVSATTTSGLKTVTYS
ncbi:hypothetical protein TNCT_344221 [Trichonephila clavata]|uniref:Uncharacterized protein n=1 Tax=Trichonephila clavata TaxID=2740835 RepID=A0A8X6H4N3_TRICU|nr:hypothetical protein TNCT_344221 [Trichonephila clavata]